MLEVFTILIALLVLKILIWCITGLVLSMLINHILKKFNLLTITPVMGMSIIIIIELIVKLLRF